MFYRIFFVVVVILSLTVQINLPLKFKFYNFFISGQTYKISRGSNYFSHTYIYIYIYIYIYNQYNYLVVQIIVTNIALNQLKLNFIELIKTHILLSYSNVKQKLSWLIDHIIFYSAMQICKSAFGRWICFSVKLLELITYYNKMMLNLHSIA